MKTIRVLFVGGAKRYSAAKKLIQAGKELGLVVEIYAYEMGFGLPIADIATVIQGKNFLDPDIQNHLEETLRELSIDIALPYHDKAILPLAALSHVAFVPTCRSDRAQTFSSKVQSAQLFRQQAILVPPYSAQVPAIAKPDLGSSSQGLLRFTEQFQLDAFLASPEQSQYEIQDLVSGPEYSVDGYIALHSDFCHFAVRQRLEILGGEAVRSQTVDIPQVESVCRRISKISGVHGAITIQFIFDNRNDIYGVMEVNPRFGGGMLTSWGAGVPWFHILLRDFLDLPQSPVCHKMGILMVRSFREHFFNTEV